MDQMDKVQGKKFSTWPNPSVSFHVTLTIHSNMKRFGQFCPCSKPINTDNPPLPLLLTIPIPIPIPHHHHHHPPKPIVAMFNSMATYSDPSPLPPVTFSAAPPPPPHPHPFSYSSSLPSSYSLHRSSFSPPIHAHYISHPSPHHHPPPPPPHLGAAQPSSPSSSSSTTSGDYPDFNSGPFRRVFSAGDLQGMNGSQVPSENCGQDGGSVAMKASRYTAEERKERIERYRSKRHQRNFHKKITYACRKTLADSRPRVRGRFAQNREAQTAEAVGNSYESFSYNNNYAAHQQRECSNFDRNSDDGGGGGRAGWGQNLEEECCFLDEDLWINFDDVFPVDFPY